MKLFEVLQPLLENKVDHIAKNQSKKIWNALLADSTTIVMVNTYDPLYRGNQMSIQMRELNDLKELLDVVQDGFVPEFYDYEYDYLIQVFKGMVEKIENVTPDWPIAVSVSIQGAGSASFRQQGKISQAQELIQEAAAYAVQFMADSISTKYLQWVVNRYIRGDFLLAEDTQVIKQSLDIYHQIKSELNVELTNKVSTGDLFELVEPYKEAMGVETQRAKEKELLANGEIEIPFSVDTNEIVIIPKTFEASYYLSEPNGWCTQYENWFDKYTKDDQILYYFRHNGSPYLVHWESSQFMKKGNKHFDREKLYESSSAFQWIINQKADEVRGQPLDNIKEMTIKILMSLGLMDNKEVVDSMFESPSDILHTFVNKSGLIDSIRNNSDARHYFIKKLYDWVLDDSSRDISIAIRYHLKMFTGNSDDISLSINMINKLIEQYGSQTISDYLESDISEFSMLIRAIIENIDNPNDIFKEEITSLLKNSLDIIRRTKKPSPIEAMESSIFSKFNPKKISDDVYHHITENIMSLSDDESLGDSVYKRPRFKYRLLGYLTGKEDFDYVDSEFDSLLKALIVVNVIVNEFEGDAQEAAFNSIVDELMDRVTSDGKARDNSNRIEKIIALGNGYAKENISFTLKPLIDSVYEKVDQFSISVLIKIIIALESTGEITIEDDIGELVSQYGVDNLQDTKQVIKELVSFKRRRGGEKYFYWAKTYADDLYKQGDVSISYLVSVLGGSDASDIIGLDENQIKEKLVEEVTLADDRAIIVNLEHILESIYISDEFKVEMITEAVEWNPHIRHLEYIIIDAWQFGIIQEDDKAVYFAEEMASVDEYNAENLASVLFDASAVDEEWFKQYLPSVYEENYGEEEV